MGLAHQLPSVVLHVHYWVTLDRHFTVIAACPEWAGLLGLRIWDANPEAEDVLRDTYRDAWQTGNARTVTLLRGRLWDIRVVRDGNVYNVLAQPTEELDTSTLSALEVSLHRIASACETEAERLRPRLRAV